MESKIKKSRLVWDLPVRLFHWLLVLAIAAQWYTGEQGDTWLEWHFYIGYFTLGLILFRVVWGFCGTRYALFSEFLVSPGKALKSLKDKSSQFIGHTPLGGYMTVLLLVVIFLQAMSGLFTSDEIFTDGPWRSVISGDYQELADWAHGNLFTVIQVAVALHIAAAFYYLIIKKQNLIRAMIDGKKSISKDKTITSSKLWLALLLLLLVTGVVLSLIYFAPEVQMDDYF
ncbi:cytochrome b/b6 domain-containing protein [Planctobacterium marinum]|uniref:Cytochrome b561 n=1 Tax=Planctobacterium marinum TaxID=1631968 RepID=A0AA48HM24_9ALTE|nr:cytochrome b561 [Planctobacterium marinum]